MALISTFDFTDPFSPDIFDPFFSSVFNTSFPFYDFAPDLPQQRRGGVRRQGRGGGRRAIPVDVKEASPDCFG